MERRTAKTIRNNKRSLGIELTKTKSWKETTGLKDEMKIRKLMLESVTHDHDKCDCAGCYWWTMTRTMFDKGRFFYVVPSWDDLERDEYLRTMQRVVQYKIDKNQSKEKVVAFLMKNGATKEQAEKMAEQMMAPIFSVMFGKAPSPMGLLRDI